MSVGRRLVAFLPALVLSLGLCPVAVVSLGACGGSSGSPFDGESPGDDAGGNGDDAGGGLDGGTNPRGLGDGDSGTTTKPDAATSDASGADAGDPNRLQTVFVIMMENHSWSTIKGNDRAPFLNSLLPLGGHAEQYSTPPANHPSELNYIWLEAGGALGITTDDAPAKNHQATKDHLVTLLDKAGVSWKAYAEEVSGTACPLTDQGKFVTRHVPMLFFDDVTGTNDPTNANCIAHVRPYAELAADLTGDKVARYNLVTPNLCDDMHGLTLACGTTNFDEISAGDTWLKNEVPKMASDAFKKNGVLFIVWDEGDEGLIGNASDGPIPFLVLSPKAKAGYTSQTKLTHSAMLRSVQQIMGVTPLLGDAKNAPDLGEFFTSFP